MNIEKIYNLIYEIRGEKVMFDFDLASLYQVETKVLNQSIKRNIDRFPKDFMFRLTEKEWKKILSNSDDNWSQIVTSSYKHRGAAYLPYVFTEHGVTMLASILRSEKAVKMNIAIVRAFIAMRKFALNYKDIVAEIAELKKTVGTHDKKLNQLFQALELLLQEKQHEKDWSDRERIGFKK
jgi:phage regulator Rha-like protein